MEKPCFGYTIRYAPNRFGARADAVSAGPLPSWNTAVDGGVKRAQKLQAEGFVLISLIIEKVRLTLPDTGGDR